MHVLVVDGDPASRRWATRMLPGDKVDAVARAEEAIARLRRERYEAVVVGRRPDDAGGATLHLVRDLRARSPEAGIVLLADHPRPALRREALRMGADAVHARTDDGAELRALLDAALAARHGSSRPRAPASLPSDLARGVQAVLDLEETERAVRAERAFQLALLAKAALASRYKGAFARCAAAVGLDRTSLQPYALIARWDTAELRELLVERRNPYGEPISVCHLALLARLSESKRKIWIERVLSQGMTVGALRKALRRSAGAKKC